MHATALIATPATDAALRRQCRAKGAAAWRAGAKRECRYDPNSMIAAFWFEGWDGEAALHAFPHARPTETAEDGAS